MKGVFVAIFLVAHAGLAASANTMLMEMFSAQFGESKGANTIPKLAAKLGLDTFVSWLEKAGLDTELSSCGPFTVFAPTDAAFDKLPESLRSSILNNGTLLSNILRYHVVDGKYFIKDLRSGELLTSEMSGQKIRVEVFNKSEETVVAVSGSKIVLADQVAKNGVIHTLDSIMFPPVGTIAELLSMCPEMSMMRTALEKVGLLDFLNGPLEHTLFLPMNSAFKKIPERCLNALLNSKDLLTKVLLYHMVGAMKYTFGMDCGDKIRTLNIKEEYLQVVRLKDDIYVDQVKLIRRNFVLTNGLVHTVESVLIPGGEVEEFCASVMSNTDTLFVSKTQDIEMDIVEKLIN